MKYTEEEIMRIAKSAIGKKLGDFDKTGKLSNRRNKGSIGNVIQSGLFGLPENNKAEPDFEDLGIELKVTPYRVLKGINDNKLRYIAKERLTLHSISYDRDNGISLKQSDLWKKCKRMLIIFYEYKINIPVEEFIISAVLLWDLEKENQKILENDWETIQRFIIEGKAEEISEKYTAFLGACTKAKNSYDLVKQPNSMVWVKRRAYCLKQRYMTNLVSEVMNCHVPKYGKTRLMRGELDMSKTFIDNITDKLNSYCGKSQSDLVKFFGIDSNDSDKGVFRRITWAILNSESPEAKSDLDKSGIIVKTIRIEEDDTNKESMSFQAFSFKGIIEEKWEDSYIYNLFKQNVFLFVVFKKHGHEYFLESSFFWRMPDKDLDIEFKSVYEKTQDVICKGVVLEGSSIIKNNLPKSNENKVAHVRPHAAKASYKPLDPNADELPDGRWMTKQSFFLNKSYVSQILKENLKKRVK